MNDYFLRAIESDWPTVLALGVTLGILTVTEEGQHVATSGGWDHIGAIYEPTGEVVVVDGIEVALTEPVRDPEGSLYLHANLRTLMSLDELQDLSPHMLLDEFGQPWAPNTPARVFF